MLTHHALTVFDQLPLAERLFVRARLITAPLDELAKRVHGTRMLDVGCGHGLLCSMLALGFPDRQIVGIDPDPKKIDWARRSVGKLGNTRFDVMTVERLASIEPESFDTVCVSDVLYLLPTEAWPEFFAACHQLLKKKGVLLLKEAEDDGGWRTRKALLQEQVMVKVLGRTKGSGAIGFSKRESTKAMLERAGFKVEEIVSLKAGSTTPHVLFVAKV
ncbi:MAG: class I SAM-dependent methyltransferase [Archangium sp.]|nr:class I SAM-dependent methyltransferase [Archangium sp.]